ncbi:carboxypeptidase-like regulatory domain-containing protein [Maribacter sp. PR1]|uniref:Carboxypeptidase-like regulatory domain-containing protein n=1 Tax=Maribacter cobaltidurans TaxID=1178778 RepID=A0ABU7IZA0_9FLAO|nr:MULTISPECIES: carboxypeptidase-like regulatory domain-containing protein [Maribacter]MDC6390933.1 carboxypeptidase-like regulatory domain-containing protein [Maribacter sp. PR1]MEE1978325.1 carboxypeptidase-like regulatory domain-containing protein [Maribacter cobaltidurans]
MKNILFTFLVLFTTFSFAQSTGKISGKILDAEMFNEPLLMASISLKDTDWSDTTNFNGNFEITSIEPGTYILQIRFLGYESIEKVVHLAANEEIYLQEALSAKSLPSAVMDTAERADSDKQKR